MGVSWRRTCEISYTIYYFQEGVKLLLQCAKRSPFRLMHNLDTASLREAHNFDVNSSALQNKETKGEIMQLHSSARLKKSFQRNWGRK
jgi:hypothetical protein